VEREEPKPTGVLPPQDTHLMSKGNELEFQEGAASEAESEHGNDGGKRIVMMPPTVRRWRENL